MDYSVDYYEEDNGDKPVQIFLRELKQRNKRLWAFAIAGKDKIKQRAYHREPLSKHLEGELYELRPNKVRIIYCFDKIQQKMIYLLHGFIKGTQKTPLKELKIARERLGRLRERSSYDKNKA